MVIRLLHIFDCNGHGGKISAVGIAVGTHEADDDRGESETLPIEMRRRGDVAAGAIPVVGLTELSKGIDVEVKVQVGEIKIS